MFPFFFGLERTGYFRADAIAEVKGLDNAYFGGLQLGGGEDDVAPEQIEKLSKQIEHRLHHRKQQRQNSDKGSVSASSKCTSDSVVSTEIQKGQDSSDDDDDIMGNAKDV
jgi:hypothetical protein